MTPPRSTGADAAATHPANASAPAARARSAAAKAAPAKAGPAKAASAKAAPAKAGPAKAAPAKAGPANAGPANAAEAPSGAARSRSAGWSDSELADIRAELVGELSSMGSDYSRSLAELEELQSSGAAGSGDDQADAGAATFEREQELSIVANRRDLLEQMQRAIARIDAGTYGFCERCGKAIPKARLQAFPAATLDVGCKQREERR